MPGVPIGAGGGLPLAPADAAGLLAAGADCGGSVPGSGRFALLSSKPIGWLTTVAGSGGDVGLEVDCWELLTGSGSTSGSGGTKSGTSGGKLGADVIPPPTVALVFKIEPH